MFKMGEKEKRIIEELFLIKNIIKYIVVDDSKVFEKERKKQSKLEEEVSKTEIKKKPDSLEFLEEVLFELKNIKGKDNFSFDMTKEKKEIKEVQSFVVKYQENEREERLTFEGDNGKERYSFDIAKEKVVCDEQPYQLNVLYESNNGKERLEVKYNLRDYPTERENALQDFTNQLDKTLHIMPKSIMGGVLGYTYLGENFMARRDDLSGSKALMVDVHEAIHTPDEYETRILTDWILSRERMRYKR